MAIFRREPGASNAACRWGIGRDRDSGRIAGYLRLLDVRSAKNIYRRRSWHMTQTATHRWLSIDCWTCELRSDKTVTDDHMQCRSHSRRRTSECLFVTACSMDQTNTPKKGKKKRIYLYAVVYLKPKQLIIKDCARRFVLKLYRHEASRGLFAASELLVWLTV